MLTLARRLGQADTSFHGTTVSALIELPASAKQAATFSHDGYDLLRAAARGEFIGLPAVLLRWLDLSEKIIATLMAPVSACCDVSGQAAPAATVPGQPAAPHGSHDPEV